MSLPDTTRVVDELPVALRPAFAPLVKSALGIAFGVLLGLFLFALALMGMMTGEATFVWLLRNNYFLVGYTPSAVGAVLGLAWGFGLGFVAGWITAGCRNFILVVWVAVVGGIERARANQEFLDDLR